jgi:hypothetical protein
MVLIRDIGMHSRLHCGLRRSNIAVLLSGGRPNSTDTVF